MSPPRLYCIPHLRHTALHSDPCDCIESGNLEKPKQHGSDLHAKNCAVYELRLKAEVIRQHFASSLHRAIRKAEQQNQQGYTSWVEKPGYPATLASFLIGGKL